MKRKFILLFFSLIFFNHYVLSQDTAQWYWSHAFGINNNFRNVKNIPHQTNIKQPGFNFISNWKRVSPKSWVLSVGINFKSERLKSERNVLIGSSNSSYDTVGYYIDHSNTRYYYLNFGVGKKFTLNEKWKMEFLFDIYFGGFQKENEYQINFNTVNNTRLKISHNNYNDLDAELFLGGSVELSFSRLISKRSYLFLGLRYDGKLNSLWDKELTTYLNANFGISTLLLADKNGFPYRNKMKRKYVQASDTKNAIIGELFGAGFVYSINYDRSLIKKNKYNLIGRLGVSYWDNTSMLVFGVANAFGSRNTRLETGVYYNQGFYKTWDRRTGYEYMIFPFLGIRKHKKEHYLSRLGICPFFDFKSWEWNLSCYFSFGYRF